MVIAAAPASGINTVTGGVGAVSQGKKCPSHGISRANLVFIFSGRPIISAACCGVTLAAGHTMNGNDWTKRYPRIVEEAARLREPIIIDAEVVHLSADGAADFDALHSRTVDDKAVALAFDLLLSGEDIRRQPLIERKTALKWVLRKAREGIQYVEHAEGHGDKLFVAVCNLGLEGIVSKRLTSVYKSGPSKTWIKVKNPKSPAATRAVDGTF